MNILSKLPDDIINYIIYNTNIKCHVCKRSYNLTFYKKESNFYYCSQICYNFI